MNLELKKISRIGCDTVFFLLSQLVSGDISYLLHKAVIGINHVKTWVSGL